MSIITEVEPQDIQPAHNKNIFVFDSTNKGEDKFEYVCSIEVGGSSIANLKVQSNPQGYGILDVSRHLQNYISYDLPTSDLFKSISNSTLNYTLEVAERYTRDVTITVVDNGGLMQINFSLHQLVVGDFVTISGTGVTTYDAIHEVVSVDSSNAVTLNTAYTSAAIGTGVRSDGAATTQSFATIGTYQVINNVIKHNDTWDNTDYEINAVDMGTFLTNLPNGSMVRLDDFLTINFLTHLDNSGGSMQGNTLGITTSDGRTYYFENTITGEDLIAIGVGPKNIEGKAVDATISQPALPVITDDVEWYDVFLVKSGFLGEQVVSALKRFTIDRSCTSDGATTLTYLNTGGSWSVFHFLGERTKTISNKKTTYRKNVGAFDGVSEYGYSKSDRGLTTINVDVTEKHTINSRYLRSSEGDLIEDLINSPEVYEVSGSDLLPINIDTTSVKIKKKSIDKLISYSLDFQYSNKNKVQ